MAINVSVFVVVSYLVKCRSHEVVLYVLNGTWGDLIFLLVCFLLIQCYVQNCWWDTELFYLEKYFPGVLIFDSVLKTALK